MIRSFPLVLASATLLCANRVVAQEISATDRQWSTLEAAVTEVLRSHETEAGGSISEEPEIAEGDLDGDEREDAAILYTIEGVGSGTNYTQYLAVLVRRGEGWSFGASTTAGGKWERAVTLQGIEHRAVLLETMDYAEGDPSCCPSIEGETRYHLRHVLEESEVPRDQPQDP